MNDFSCSCIEQYTGKRCELDVDECTTPDICENGGTCSNEFGSYNCTCVSGYTGNHCEMDIDECKSDDNICLNDGVCRNFPGGFSCECSGSWSGDRCDVCNISVDNCRDHNCDDIRPKCNSCLNRCSFICGECGKY